MTITTRSRKVAAPVAPVENDSEYSSQSEEEVKPKPKRVATAAQKEPEINDDVDEPPTIAEIEKRLIDNPNDFKKFKDAIELVMKNNSTEMLSDKLCIEMTAALLHVFYVAMTNDDDA